MRYQLIQLIQLLFALGLIFVAFAGGIAVGWWRWGRERDGAAVNEGPAASPGVLFSTEAHETEVAVAEIHLGDGAGTRPGDGLVFGTGNQVSAPMKPPPLPPSAPPVGAIGPSAAQPAAAAPLDG